MKKRIVRVTYKFEVRYEHDEHRDNIIRELLNDPIFDMSGAGIASDERCYGYECRRIGKGKVSA